MSPGALLDRIACLEVGLENGAGEAGWGLQRELARLIKIFERETIERPGLRQMRSELRVIHEAIWEAENELNECERRDDFGSRFVQWCRILRQRQAKRREIDRAVNEAPDTPDDDSLWRELAIARETNLHA